MPSTYQYLYRAELDKVDQEWDEIEQAFASINRFASQLGIAPLLPSFHVSED